MKHKDVMPDKLSKERTDAFVRKRNIEIQKLTRSLMRVLGEDAKNDPELRAFLVSADYSVIHNHGHLLPRKRARSKSEFMDHKAILTAAELGPFGPLPKHVIQV